jgi:hypothetical protein
VIFYLFHKDERFVMQYNEEGEKTSNTTPSEHFENPIEKIVERGNIDTSNTQIHAHSLS